MDEIDYQLSLILLDFLLEKGLLEQGEAAEMNRQLQEYYQPTITGLTGLLGPLE